MEILIDVRQNQRALTDGLSMGLGFTAVLVVLGSLREMVGMGTLLSQAHLMFGDGARGLTLRFGEDYHGLLMAVLPPGAFIGLGLIIALKNVIDRRAKQARAEKAAGAMQPAESRTA